MAHRQLFEQWYTRLHQQFAGHESYRRLLDGDYSRTEALAFVRNLCRAHLRSPHVLGFLFAVTPPRDAQHVQDNLLEELGYHEGETPHPELLQRLAQAIGLAELDWTAVEKGADQILFNKIEEPLMFGTIKEVGLNVMLEVVGFEWFLARESGRFGQAIRRYFGVDDAALIWFSHHSEVDVAHAEQGLDTLAAYVDSYGLDESTVRNIGEITFRENIYLKRYLDLQVESGI
jgi:pyrroloquinoline quinone (PQQ) biosynthesis protein C